MQLKKKLRITALLLLPLFLIGCQNARDFQDLVIVTAVGIDKSDKGADQIRITAQIILPGNITSGIGGAGGGGGGGSEGQKPYINVETSGNTVQTTLRSMTDYTINKLYLSHNEAIIFGRSIAKKGIRRHLDFFVRDNEGRPTTKIFVADNLASEVLDVAASFETLPSSNLSSLIIDQKRTSYVKPVEMHEVVKKLLSKTASFVLPIVSVEEMNGQKIHKIAGMAVFKSDKMVGELDKTESSGLLFALGEAKYGLTPVNYKDQEVSLEIISSSSKIKPKIDGENISFSIKIKMSTAISEQTGTEPIGKKEDLDELEKLQKQKIEEEVYSAFSAAKELNADIFGFGELLRKHYPEKWSELESNWDKVFKTVNINVSIDNQIRNMGLSSKPLVPEEKNVH
ncbi:MAG: Ger(x)C family spore germination protein [Oscillospiraceae bacterium]|jgi:spore germination protein KC